MAFRSTKPWKPLFSRLTPHHDAATFATSTAPRMKAFAAGTADLGHKSGSSKAGDYVPVSVSIGLIFLSISFGLYTARHQILHSPGVHVKKSRRETIPEVVEPETVTHESEEFLTKSFFRKIAHVQDFDIVIPNKPGKDSFSYSPKVETLKSVGVDPKP